MPANPSTLLLALDQGTTSTRAILFRADGTILAQHAQELRQSYPQTGWVEHDAEHYWRDAITCCRAVLDGAGADPGAIAGLGITNQRETTVLWDRKTGVPVAPAICWQDRRTASMCRDLQAAGHERLIRDKTGLLIDPYFSGTKVAWLLDHVDGLRARAEAGEIAFGTVDSWLIYKLTGGRMHVTDATNASRTLLFDIRTHRWDADLCALLNIPMGMLPEVRDNAAEFGMTDPAVLGMALPIRGSAGDQQAAVFGQGCTEPGMVKSTYGTGCFALMTVGPEFVLSRNRLLTTIGFRLNGQTTYAIEGAIFVAGAAVQWLRDGLGLIATAADSEARAQRVPDTGGVYMVPAFAGLGAPHWDPEARGAIVGLSRGTTADHIIRAALEAQGYQTRDLVEAMMADSRTRPRALRVDGGMVANDWVCQFLADLIAVPVERPTVIETTALGAAYLAGLQAGVYGSVSDIAVAWTLDRRFEPQMPARRRETLYAGWRAALNRTRSDLK